MCAVTGVSFVEVNAVCGGLRVWLVDTCVGELDGKRLVGGRCCWVVGGGLRVSFVVAVCT